MILGTQVALGPILPVDIPSLFQWSDDLEDARLNEPYLPRNWHRQEAFWLNSEGDPSRLFFAIHSLRQPEIIGYVRIMQIDAIHRSATIGIRIGDRGNRGQGKGRDAMLLAIRYCWDHLNLARLGLSVFADNDPAIALYRSLGFREEGRLRQARFIAGRWIDVVLMGLLRVDQEHHSAA